MHTPSPTCHPLPSVPPSHDCHLTANSRQCPNPRLQAWAAMHARAQPLLLRAPALQRYLDFPVRWFQQLGVHRQ